MGKDRYIVSRNDAEAEKDRAVRQAIVTGLEAQLKKGDKALVGNSAYRRYLKTSGALSARTRSRTIWDYQFFCVWVGD